MKSLRGLAMLAGAVCAPSLALAQYYPYAAPAPLPAPNSQVRPLNYTGATYQGAENYNPESVATPSATPTPAHPGYPSAAPHYDGALANDGNCSTCNGGEYGGGYDGGYAGDGYGLGLFGGCCGDCCGPTWYGSIAGLYMERNRPNPMQISFDTTNPTGQLILNNDTIDDHNVGWDLRVGRYFGCNSAVELGYWGLEDFEGSAVAFDPVGIGNLNTPFDFRILNFGGIPVNDWFDNSQIHQLTRTNEIHNLELNFVRWPMQCDPCSRFQASGLVGLRYINFREDWAFATCDSVPMFGVDPANEAYYTINVENQLFGLQLGGRASFCVTRCLSVYAAPRFGVFANYMDHHSRIFTGDGEVALDIESNTETVSLLGQLDMGVNYQVTPCLGLWAGYRVVSIAGIALADAQIPYLLDDFGGIADIDHNSNLVLHGVMAGATYNF